MSGQEKNLSGKGTQSSSQPMMRPGGMNRRNMGAPVEKAKDRQTTLRRLVRYFGDDTLLIIVLFCAVVLTVAGSVAGPGLQSRAIDMIVSGEYSKVGHYLGLMLCVYLMSGAATLLQELMSAALSQRITKKMRGDLFSHIVSLPIPFIDGHAKGDLLSRMTNDADNISNVISQSLGSLFSGVLTLAGTLGMMIYFSPALALISCTSIVLTVVVTRLLTKYMRIYFLRRQELLGALNATVEEMVTNTRTVTAYNLQDKVIGIFSETSDELTKTGIMAEVIGSSMGPVMNMLGNISFVIVAVFGAWFALKGYITVGVISAFIIYARQFSRPINEIAQLYGQIQTALAGAERIFEILDTPGEDLEGDDPVTPGQGVIEFEHVDFSYVPGRKVISDFNLRVESGKRIALVGATGSGKTTIINLLMRFYEPDSGRILLDGRDISSIALPKLRDDIGIVLQDTVLFTDTVRRNLAYACPDADDEQLDEAARQSSSDRFIRRLPEGYDTMIGENVSLSQGQQQLLAIGRAFLSYPNILILDEATSSVDTRTEKRIQDAMTTLMKNRTNMIIAHRLSTIRDADLIIVMEQGRIAEQGSHDELLEKKGKYYDLYMTQFSGNAT